jgi:UDP-glucose-4-epimerase GalE
MARILVTGGAGYIGSHTAHHLLRLGHDVVVVDNLSRGYRHNVPPGRLRELDLADTPSLDRLLAAEPCDAVIHFAAFIAVGESTRDPELYFFNNIGGSLALLSAMRRAGVRRLVFSSTAAVYGNPERVPIPESAPLAPVSPYGESKLAVERVLRSLDEYAGLRYVTLRYFNACGADPALGLGEEHEPETHLIPLVFRAMESGEPLTVFGDDYDTADGTCIRDYIHVMDLAKAHALALDHLLAGGASGEYNAGTGQGHSVLEVIQAAERVTGRKVPYRVGPRREGDAAELVADASRLEREFAWRPEYATLESMVASAWAFEQGRRRRDV